MPHLRIETNLPRSKIPEDFVIKAQPIIASTLGKPEHYCAVSVIPDLPMSFSGTKEPCAIGNLTSIGHLGVEENKKHSKVLFDFIEKELGISPDRMYITFQDVLASDAGYKGITFNDIVIE